jgi:hypothetical protein
MKSGPFKQLNKVLEQHTDFFGHLMPYILSCTLQLLTILAFDIFFQLKANSLMKIYNFFIFIQQAFFKYTVNLSLI